MEPWKTLLFRPGINRTLLYISLKLSNTFNSTSSITFLNLVFHPSTEIPFLFTLLINKNINKIIHLPWNRGRLCSLHQV